MSFASGTATNAEAITLYNAIVKLEVMLRQIKNGDRRPTDPGRFTQAEIDTQITAVSAAITAVNA